MWASPEVLTLILDLIVSLRYLVEPQKVNPTLNGKHSVAYIKPSPIPQAPSPLSPKLLYTNRACTRPLFVSQQVLLSRRPPMQYARA